MKCDFSSSSVDSLLDLRVVRREFLFLSNAGHVGETDVLSEKTRHGE